MIVNKSPPFLKKKKSALLWSLSLTFAKTTHPCSPLFSLSFLGTMSLQWMAVATFLYVEVFFVLLLCIPFISPKRSVHVSPLHKSLD